MTLTSPRPAAAAVSAREIVLQGRRIAYLEAGADSGGPVVVLLHGLASDDRTWLDVLPELGRVAHVVAPDLLGHGRSDKPRTGDYSLGAHAAGVRDLLVALGLPSATVVGHSLGGGVAMQFLYQFPEYVERLVLVASGGLGSEVSLPLRAATLPGATLVLRAAAAFTPGWAGRLARRAAAPVPPLARDVDGLLGAFASFTDRGAREAFVRTARSVLDWSGQRLVGTERFALLAEVPVLLVGGSSDAIIPVAHTVAAHDLLRDSRLHVFEGAGHFPHVEHPVRFARLVADFLADAPAAPVDPASLRRRLLREPDGSATPAR